jgi:hypothetical protein
VRCTESLLLAPLDWKPCYLSYHQLRSKNLTTNRDALPTIGAALCWQGRQKGKGHGAHKTRYEVTTSSSETELGSLTELGLIIRVFP